MSFVSYAQNCEDVLLHRIFGGQETGFYVDVGAYHPVIGSVTKALYDRGWSGINIEPGSVFAELAAARPRDINLEMAVTDHSGEITFVEDPADRGTSHVVPDGAEAGGETRLVPCDTLEAVVRAHSRGRPIDLLKVDAEGSEAAIVRSTDWRALRPRVVLIEATLPWSSTLVNQEWEPELLRHGYVRSYFDGINCFYIPEEEVAALARHFQAPVNVLDRVEHYEHNTLRAELDHQQQETLRVLAERNAIETTLDALRAERDMLHASLEALRSERDTLQPMPDADRTERDALWAERDALWAERDALWAERDERQAEIGRLVAERDALDASAKLQSREVATLTAAHEALREAMDALQQEAAALGAERDRTRAEAIHLSASLENLQTQLAPIPSLGSLPPPARGPGLRRRTALAAYRLVRPIVRPMAWRLRHFMIDGLSEQLQQLNERIAVPPPPPPPARIIEDGAAAAEMRRLAGEMERALLTLAMEGEPDSWRVDELSER